MTTSSRRRWTMSRTADSGCASGSMPVVSTACICSTSEKKLFSCASVWAASSSLVSMRARWAMRLTSDRSRAMAWWVDARMLGYWDTKGRRGLRRLAHGAAASCGPELGRRARRSRQNCRYFQAVNARSRQNYKVSLRVTDLWQRLRHMACGRRFRARCPKAPEGQTWVL
ncbi:protein of unknown function [Cupriavidus taiwanensis]|nr:protein of unknown function [Cupriavidus taiwanensis]